MCPIKDGIMVSARVFTDQVLLCGRKHFCMPRTQEALESLYSAIWWGLVSGMTRHLPRVREADVSLFVTKLPLLRPDVYCLAELSDCDELRVYADSIRWVRVERAKKGGR